MLMTMILLGAAILAFALYCKRDVKFNVKILGANVSLEARDTPAADTSHNDR